MADESDDPVDAAAWFWAEYPGLRRFAAVTGPAEVDPDDLVQEALTRTMRTRHLGELDDPGAYVRRTIVNLAANERRRLGRRRRALRRVEAATATEPTAYPSDIDDLLQLEPTTRAVLYLAEVEGRPFAEIGELLGLSETAARSQASRGRRRLRHLLDQEEN